MTKKNAKDLLCELASSRNATTRQIGEAIIACVLFDDEINFKRLLSKGVSPDLDPHGVPIISRAAHAGSIKCLKLLCQRGSSLNSSCSLRDWTPAHYAAATGSNECLLHLWGSGALVDQNAMTRETPMVVAAQNS